MATKTKSASTSIAKINFGKKKNGRHTKNVNKRRQTKKYNGQGR